MLKIAPDLGSDPDAFVLIDTDGWTTPAATVPAPAPAPAESEPAAAATAAPSSENPMGPFFHGPLEKAAANTLLLADGGAGNTGKVLVPIHLQRSIYKSL